MITAQIESFGECVPELKGIFIRHHDELGILKDLMPLDPDYGEYVRRERNGMLFLCTVRRNDNIVAYYVAQTAKGFHYASTFTGTQDICYVVPEERNKGLAVPLFRHVERELRRRGVRVWYSGSKIHNPLGMPEMLRALGFIPADMYFVKALV